MDLNKLVELTEKYPNLPAILKTGHIAAYHFKHGLNIDAEEFKELELELILAKIIVKKTNYTRTADEALQFLGEREVDYEKARVLENLYPGILGMLASGGVTSSHISMAYKITKEEAQKLIADASVYGLVNCHKYQVYIPKDVQEKLKEINLL